MSWIVCPTCGLCPTCGRPAPDVTPKITWGEPGTADDGHRYSSFTTTSGVLFFLGADGKAYRHVPPEHPEAVA